MSAVDTTPLTDVRYTAATLRAWRHKLMPSQIRDEVLAAFAGDALLGDVHDVKLPCGMTVQGWRLKDTVVVQRVRSR